jgi:hypothetical protein
VTAEPILDDDAPEPIDLHRLRRWAELAAFALDNEPERIDALLELGALIEAAIDAETDRERAA